MAELLLTSEQALAVIAELEPGSPLTYKQLRDLEARGCVRPRTLPGGRGPRVYDLGDVLLLRLIARMQADDLLARWQAWSVVAHLREGLRAALLAGSSRVLVVQGALGRIVTTREASRMSGVDVSLTNVGRGVREAMRLQAGDVWTGYAWLSSRDARALATPMVAFA